MKRAALIIAAAAGAAFGQGDGWPDYFPFTETPRPPGLAATWPVLPIGTTYYGSSNALDVLDYNPCHPESDFDRDGIVNRLDDDADGDGIPNNLESSGNNEWWTPPSRNPLWDKAMPWWDPFLYYRKRGDHPGPGWSNTAPACYTGEPPTAAYSDMLMDPCSDWDGDGLTAAGNDQTFGGMPGLDDDDDGDGQEDIYDIDHYLFGGHPSGILSVQRPELDFDGDGIPDSEDVDADGDGLLDSWETPGNRMKYSPRASATVDDWDGDGYPNCSDPAPLDPANAGTNYNPMTFDSDGDGTPDGCDPDPCDPAVFNIDSDGDGWPDVCDPQPCNPNVPADPPEDSENPCGPDGPEPPEPGEEEDDGPPPLPERPDDPGPHDRPDPNPDADDPVNPEPGERPEEPEPPEPPPPPPGPPGGGGGSDYEILKAICDRVDVLIAQGELHLENLYNINVSTHEMNTQLRQFYERTISDPDSLRNRMDDGLWTIADLLRAIKLEMEHLGNVTDSVHGGGGGGDDDDNPPGNPGGGGGGGDDDDDDGGGGAGPRPKADEPDFDLVDEPNNFITDWKFRFSELDEEGVPSESAKYKVWQEFAIFGDLDDTAANDAPEWSFALPTVLNFGPQGPDSRTETIEVDFSVVEPMRAPLWLAMYAMAFVHVCTMVWEELRRYG